MPGCTNDLPDGWRLYSIDASIDGGYRVTLARADVNRQWWLNPRSHYPLFAIRQGPTVEEAIQMAIDRAIEMDRADDMVDLIDDGDTYGMRFTI